MATQRKARKERTAAEKSADFRKLAEKHANTAIGGIARLGKLARPSRYSWTPKEIEALESAFRDELTRTFSLLKTPPATGGKVTRKIFG